MVPPDAEEEEERPHRVTRWLPGSPTHLGWVGEPDSGIAVALFLQSWNLK